MILAIDIGNTNLTLGGFREGELAFVARLCASTARTADEYAAAIHAQLAMRGIAPGIVRGSILASVVPPLNGVLCEAVEMLFAHTPLVVGPGMKTGISIHCDIPSSVGADLICASVAVQQRHGSPALIADLGTATKLILLQGKGTFAGAAILPGVQMGMDALAERTAQLPRASLERPGAVAAKNTADCMRSGVIYGHAAMLDGMIDRLCREAGEALPVYATGGHAPLVLPYCQSKIRHEEHLVLHGLYLLYEKNRI